MNYKPKIIHSVFLIPVLLFILLIIPHSASAATEVIKIIREDGTGDYTSLAAWEAAENKDLVAADEIAVAQIDGSWTNPDTTAVTIDGWTTDSTHYIKIYTTTAARHSGKWDEGKYRMEVVTQNGIISIIEDYVRIEGLQFLVSGGWSNDKVGIYLQADSGASARYISHNIIKFNPQGINAGHVGIKDAGGINYVYNNLIYDFVVGTEALYGIRAWSSGSLYIYNNTIQNSYTGYKVGGNGTFIVKNNIYQSNGISGADGFLGVFDSSSDYNISDIDGDAPNATFTGGYATVNFVDSASDDFHLSSSDTSAKDAGADLSSNANLAFTTDIDGDTRSAPWDIGADETTGTAPTDTTAPVISNESPTGTLSAGTTQTTMSITTNENATCKYGTISGTAYASIANTFATTSGTSHSTTISNLTDGTTYNYYVRCQDTSPNLNANDTDKTISFSIASPAAPDNEAPTTPTNLSATAVSSSQINLSWTASTDNVGVSGYNIYRCSGSGCTPAAFTTSTTNSYSDTGLATETTYTYAVSAYDAMFNTSSQSSPASATTQAQTANTINVVSCSQTDVQAAITSASSGDTVIVPAGNCIWTSTVSITKGITLQGAGIGNTVITWTGSGKNPFIRISLSSDLSTRVTGFTFDGNSISGNYGFYLYNGSTSLILTKIRIDHNRIYRTGWYGIRVQGMFYGLIDNNQFDTTGARALRIEGRDDYSWNDPIAPGTSKYLYIESNTFTNCYGLTSSGMGTRWIFRYNTVDTAGTDYPVLDAHGNMYNASNGNCADSRGVVGTEVYENTFNNTPGVLMFDIRGGTNLVYNNTVKTDKIAGAIPWRVTEEECKEAYGYCNCTYPGIDAVKDTYVFGDKNCDLAGQNCYTSSLWKEDYGSNLLAEMRDYWTDYNSSYFSTSLSLNRSVTCSDNDSYWETDTKKLYRCEGDNNWTFIYKPYTYPHPLALGEIPTPTYQCSDGLDNDSDGLTDYPNDPGCSSTTDNDETDPADTILPSAISDLSATDITQTSVNLVSWTAPGDDGNTGTAATYDIRYGTTQLTADNWTSATQATGEPIPSIAGTVESYTLVGLTPNTTYYAAIKTKDEADNESAISNIITFTTLEQSSTAVPGCADSTATNYNPSATQDDGSCEYAATGGGGGSTGGGGGGGGGGYYYDTTPPDKPSEFTLSPADSQITLSWNNPDDSDFVRTAIFRAESQIPKELVFSSAKALYDIIYEGTDEEYTDTNLNNTITYYYAIYSYDKKPNYSKPVILSTKPTEGLTTVTVEEETTAESTAAELNGPPNNSGFSEKVRGPFSIGMENEEVKKLQEMLATDPDIYPEAITSGYYGNLTKAAVQRFQCKQMNICEGNPNTNGYGLAGPATREKLNEVYGSSSATSDVLPSDRQALIAQLKEMVRELQIKLVELLTRLMEALKERAGGI